MSGLIEIPDFGRVTLVDQPLDGIANKGRIAKQRVAIGIGVAHRLDLVMQRLRRSPAELTKRISFQDVQHLTDRDTAGTRRRRRDHVIAAVIALDRGAFARPVALQIFQLDDSAAGPARPDDGGGGLATIETGRALPSDQAQCVGEVALHQPLACNKGLSIVEEDLAGRSKFPEVVGRRGQHVDVALIQDESAFGQFNRGPDQRGARHRAVFLARILQTRHSAGDANREPADRAQAVDDVAVLVEVHVRPRGARRRLAKIEERLSSVGKADRHEAAAAEIAGGRIDHRERISDRDRRIDRATATLENVDANLCRKMLRRDHHGLLGGHGPHRGGVGGWNHDHRPEASEQANDQAVKPHQPSQGVEPTKASFQPSPQSSQRI